MTHEEHTSDVVACVHSQNRSVVSLLSHLNVYVIVALRVGCWMRGFHLRHTVRRAGAKYRFIAVSAYCSVSTGLLFHINDVHPTQIIVTKIYNVKNIGCLLFSTFIGIQKILITYRQYNFYLHFSRNDYTFIYFDHLKQFLKQISFIKIILAENHHRTFSYFKSANLWSLRQSNLEKKHFDFRDHFSECGKWQNPSRPKCWDRLSYHESGRGWMITMRKVEFFKFTKNKGISEIGTKARLQDSQYSSFVIPLGIFEI